jgi:hypothetical protein
MSELEYLQYVPSAFEPFVVGSSPSSLPMYFWQGTIFLLVSPTMVMPRRVALSP